MSNNILYFPYINIPNNEWTTKSVLYWDTVGAIVPDIYNDNPNEFESYMRSLIENQLVKQVYTYEYLGQIANFCDAFIQLVYQYGFNIDQRRNDFIAGNDTRIHNAKVDYSLWEELTKLGLAQRDRENQQWYRVEIKTARLLMMYLATVIAKLGDFIPATDSIEYIDPSLRQKGMSRYLQQTRGKLLNDIMPCPVDVDPVKLSHFKNKYYDQLRRFRNMLEQNLISIVDLNDSELRDSKYKLVLEEMLDASGEIKAKMNESNFKKVVFGSIFGLIGAGVGYADDSRLSTSVSLLNAVYSALQGYDNASLRSPYAYLALIDKKLS
ncbi:hypothetical protein J7E24_07870 [Hymenobacter sp. ISL-91]|uniref:hypothetical protein n=1 Tax=Hymenobacter sp. ISL-91 TaxID=2819151 RepID=UPI001BE7D36B|nr:hypothetical protein [Hymenobacter sp. ISL-91]MBT2557697.1 hypothetical protein [Hymenobacter sp. ISL-91]